MDYKQCCGNCHWFNNIDSDNFGWCGWVTKNNEPESLSVYTTYGNLCPEWQCTNDRFLFDKFRQDRKELEEFLKTLV